MAPYKGYKKKMIWTDDEIKFLKDNYYNLGPREISRQMKLSFNAVRWRAKGVHNKKDFFKTTGAGPENEIKAARIYDEFAKKVRGNRAILNFPNE